MFKSKGPKPEIREEALPKLIYYYGWYIITPYSLLLPGVEEFRGFLINAKEKVSLHKLYGPSGGF